MDEKYESFESLWEERHLMAFTLARFLLPMHHSRFWEVFSISSHGAVSNMPGKRTRTFCTTARSTRSTYSTFVTFDVCAADRQFIIQQAPKIIFLG